MNSSSHKSKARAYGLLPLSAWLFFGVVFLSTAYSQDAGKALQFDGVDDYASVGDKAVLKPSTTLTIEAWVYVERQQQWAGILSNIWDTGSTESGYGLLLDGSNGIYFGLKVGTSGIAYMTSSTMSGTITLNQWHHVAATYDGASMKIYIDGALKNSKASAGTINYSPTNALAIGRYSDDDEAYYFKGRIDEIRIWNVTRSEQQIRDDRLRKLLGSESGLVGYYRCDEGGGVTAVDATSNQNHAVVFGATWVNSGALIGSGTGSGTGTLTGSVTNALNGQAISGATVSVANLSTTTSSDGSYTIANVPVGTLKADFTGTPTSGTAPLSVRFTDLSTEGTQTVTATSSGYITYSNSQVTITAGGSVTLNISLSPQLAAGSMRIVLNWSSVPRDLDSHLRTPAINGTAYHVYFSSKGSSTAPPYAVLDFDDRNGSGPETITLARLFTGTYKYYVHRYSSDGELTTSGATVQIYNTQGLVRTFQVPTTGTGRYWYVCDIDGATQAITVINTIQSTEVLSIRDFGIAKGFAAPLLKQSSVVETQASSALTWSWTFGDGGTSTQQTPSYTYQAGGTFTVRLIVTSGTLRDTLTRTNYITVTSPVTSTTLRNFNTAGVQKVILVDDALPLDSGFVFGTNRYVDQAKATTFALPSGATQGQVREVRVWFGYKKSGLSSQTYRIQIFNGTKTSGPTGSPLHSQQYSLASILADDNLQTNEQATVHTLTQPVSVSANFFVALDFGSYASSEWANVGIVSSDYVGRRVEEEWEKLSNGSWINMSDSWFTQKNNGWYMWVEAVVSTGVTSVDDAPVPMSFELYQNYPNPFNPSTIVQFTLPGNGRAVLKVFDVLGRNVATLFDQEAETGRFYRIPFDAASLPTGLYFSKLEFRGQQLVKKMMLVK